MPDIIFHESIRQGITCFPQDERVGISFIAITSVGMGKSSAITDLGRWD